MLLSLIPTSLQLRCSQPGHSREGHETPKAPAGAASSDRYVVLMSPLSEGEEILSPRVLVIYS